MMNLVEKILAAHCGKTQVSPGDFINAKVDLVLANDITAPIAIKEFKKVGVSKVFDSKKIVFVPDHFVPNKDIASAEQVKMVREFAREQGILFFECGKMGVEHVILHEQGLVLPGDIVVGADSHTCTYGALGAFTTGMGSTDIAAAMATGEVWMKVPQTIKFNYSGKLPKWIGGKDLILYTIGQTGVDGALYSAMFFCGEAIEALSMENRFTMSNMAIEAGGKAGLFRVDEKTLEYVTPRAKRQYTVYDNDADASYAKTYNFDISKIEPQVSLPHSPANARPVSQIGKIKVDQVIIGSCTNGRLEDLAVSAKLLKGNVVHPDLRTIVIPGSQQVYLDALKAGYIETFINAGVAVSTPTCGPCLGGHMGILAAGERCLATTNRNFVGRMGSPKSEVYLAGPAVAAATAIKGYIAHPDEI
ncbi:MULTISPECIES: 3-isopropylmalate dehydratase large subunit [Dehalococcoides]|jgi:3-isopropylmalate/(R)-2-methylmalate dehydratase large subunit|uniref:3-isopropylmalate dehydratase large subunit n=1 Tax=Dehalococcoides TaxID=61434 RepID=UPI00059C0D0C|nr:3-isopropylmalate dehydratase large subunit [Dehalococcoides mccartyi]AQX74593.1 3-isopropylmalate dehydratase large subunit [Dehalococcoides mccartyi]AQY73171.1 3-isopropylmalate dehydratase large subunit [Dehalococcoides mccartyi]OBW62422.1 MAG: 3-isopropylmalate dehydratase large subunit [Dehalococcoides mccartyi]BAS31816.1 3-isopropylmalate dehydratase large subunit [Dehalococcoides mccartyi IBARAKI]